MDETIKNLTSGDMGILLVVIQLEHLYKLDNSGVVKFFVKTNDGTDRWLIFVVWGVSYVLAESLKPKGSISSSSFYGQWADYCSHVFSLIHPVGEFSFKEMRTWGQPMTSFCCLCVSCESRELGGGGDPRF